MNSVRFSSNTSHAAAFGRKKPQTKINLTALPSEGGLTVPIKNKKWKTVYKDQANISERMLKKGIKLLTKTKARNKKRGQQKGVGIHYDAQKKAYSLNFYTGEQFDGAIRIGLTPSNMTITQDPVYDAPSRPITLKGIRQALTAFTDFAKTKLSEPPKTSAPPPPSPSPKHSFLPQWATQFLKLSLNN